MWYTLKYKSVCFNSYSITFPVTFGMTSVTMFYYTNVMKGLFKGLNDVTQVSEFWDVSFYISVAVPIVLNALKLEVFKLYNHSCKLLAYFYDSSWNMIC